jgi:hypothetical protein
MPKSVVDTVPEDKKQVKSNICSAQQQSLDFDSKWWEVDGKTLRENSLTGNRCIRHVFFLIQVKI